MKIIHQDQENSNPVQLSLFELGHVSAEVAVKSGTQFYYITRRRNSEMMVDYDHDGGCQWLEHDTRFITPHLFNSHQAATIIASRNGWEVKRWQYSRV